MRFPLLFTVLMVSILLAVFPCAGAERKDVDTVKGVSGIQFKDGLLKVSVEKQKFQDIIDMVSQKTGTKIITSQDIDDRLTIHFDYRPLEEGLKTLLSGRDYILFYRSAESQDYDNLTKVLILPKTEGRTGAVLSREIIEDKKPETTVKTVDVENVESEEKAKYAELTPQEKLNKILEDLTQQNKNISKEFNEIFQEIMEHTGPAKLVQSDEHSEETEEMSKKNFGEALKKIIQNQNKTPIQQDHLNQ